MDIAQMLRTCICTTMNWEVAPLSYRKQGKDKLEETETQMHPLQSDKVCHGGWLHATKPRFDFYVTTGENNGGGEGKKK